jgi:cyclophilin family peptidyl-prolyl cis-trans isomerase
MKSLLTALSLIMGVAMLTDGCLGPAKNPVVVLETSEGNIELELFPKVAPKHVQNFLNLVQKGFYDSLIFHRVIDGFMIQTGDPNGDGSGGSGATVPAEFNDSLHHAGTLGMARSSNPNSASSQFYICLAPTPHLDHQYTVFGKTIKGFEVVQKIGKTPTSGPISRIQSDAQWREELLKLKQDGKADVTLIADGIPAPDRPLQKVFLIRAYEKK